MPPVEMTADERRKRNVCSWVDRGWVNRVVLKNLLGHSHRVSCVFSQRVPLHFTTDTMMHIHMHQICSHHRHHIRTSSLCQAAGLVCSMSG